MTFGYYFIHQIIIIFYCFPSSPRTAFYASKTLSRSALRFLNTVTCPTKVCQTHHQSYQLSPCQQREPNAYRPALCVTAPRHTFTSKPPCTGSTNPACGSLFAIRGTREISTGAAFDHTAAPKDNNTHEYNHPPT